MKLYRYTTHCAPKLIQTIKIIAETVDVYNVVLSSKLLPADAKEKDGAGAQEAIRTVTESMSKQ